MNTIYIKVINEYNLSLNAKPGSYDVARLAGHHLNTTPDVIYSISSQIYSKDEIITRYESFGTILNAIEAHIQGTVLQPDRPITDPTGTYEYSFNDDIPMDLATAKSVKNGEINLKTGLLIETGKHNYNAKDYSMSNNAQKNIMADKIDYIDGILTDITDDRIYSLTNDTTLPLPCSQIKAFYTSMKTAINGIVASGQVLRDSVNACENYQDIIKIEDNRT